MEPKYITFEQAKWLYRIGYEFDTEEDFTDWDEEKFNDLITSPEQHQVVDWLLEKHGIWVHSTPENNEEDIVKWCYTIQSIDTEVRFIRRFGEFNSPQEAYSAAFDYLISQNII